MKTLSSNSLIILGGIVNTGFLVFHLIHDWSYINTLPVIIILSLLTLFSFSSFFLTKNLLTKGYGKIIYGTFLLLYVLRIIRSIQDFIQQKENINTEDIWVFIGCALCILFYVAGLVVYKKQKNL